MSLIRPGTDGTFIVDLSDLKVPAVALDHLEEAIQKTVLHELATVDTAPDFSVRLSRSKGNFLDIQDFGRTRGIQITAAARADGG